MCRARERASIPHCCGLLSELPPLAVFKCEVDYSVGGSRVTLKRCGKRCDSPQFYGLLEVGINFICAT